MTERKIMRNKKRKKILISIIIIILIAAVGFMLVNNQFIKGIYYKDNPSATDNNPVIPISSDADYITFKNLLITSVGNIISAYNIKGEQVEQKRYSEISAIVSHYSDLHLKACDNYIIAYDKGGTGAVIFNNNKILSKISSQSKIIFAKPFNNGEFLIIAEDSNAKNQVILYSQDAKEKYKWHSGMNNILDATYSPSIEKLVIITAQLSTGVFNSKIQFFDIDNPAPVSETTFDNVFFTNINFYNKDEILVLSDMGLYYFNKNGKHRGTYSFNNKMLTCYKQMPGGMMALSFGSKSGNGTVVEVVNSKAELIGVYDSPNDVYSIDATSNNILLCGLREISLIGKKGSLIRNFEYDKDLQKAFFLNNKFVLIGNSEIRIIN